MGIRHKASVLAFALLWLSHQDSETDNLLTLYLQEGKNWNMLQQQKCCRERDRRLVGRIKTVRHPDKEKHLYWKWLAVDEEERYGQPQHKFWQLYVTIIPFLSISSASSRTNILIDLVRRFLLLIISEMWNVYTCVNKQHYKHTLNTI